MSEASADRARRSSGFTLIEVLVVIAVMAIIATVLTAVVAVILRTTSPTNARAADSSTLHGLNTYLARDASATAPGDFDFNPGAATNCAGATPGPGTSLVKMTWSENTGSVINYVANYRYVDKGGGKWMVVRYTCSGAGAGPYGNVVTRELTRPLGSTLPTVIGVGSPTIGVEMTVITQKGEPIKVDGDSRNPAETLVATTTSSTTTTPTTIACSVSSLSATPNPVANANNPPSRLTVAVTVNLTTSGSCGVLTLRFDRGDGSGVQSKPFTGTAPNFTATLPSSGSERWADGNHVLTVYNGATPMAPTVTLVVT